MKMVNNIWMQLTLLWKSCPHLLFLLYKYDFVSLRLYYPSTKTHEDQIIYLMFKKKKKKNKLKKDQS